MEKMPLSTQSPLSVRIVRGGAEVRGLRLAYEVFYERVAAELWHPFFSPEWLYGWMDTMGEARVPVFIVAEDDAGTMRGLWPFVECPGIAGTGLWPMCYQTADAFEPVLGREDEEAKRVLFEGISILLEDYVFVWLPLLGALWSGNIRRTRKKIRGQVMEKPWCTNAWIDLTAASFEEYWEQQLKSKTRQTIRRQQRRLADEGEVSYRFVREPGDMAEALKRMELIERSSWKGGAQVGLLRRPEVLQFYERALPELAQKGRVQIAFLYLDERAIAYEFGFVWANRYGMHNLAFRPEYAVHSPGKLLMARSIESCFEQGRVAYDFLQGSSEYKLHLATGRQDMTDWMFFSPSWRGRLNQLAVGIFSALSRRKLRQMED